MNIFNWLKSRFSSRGRALSLYRRGMTSDQKHDRQGAIDDYTATIDMPDAPSDVKAMAFYSRALVHVAAGDDQNGVDDLGTVLTMDEARMYLKTMARQKLARMESGSRKGNL
jgi:hypothetical protein